MSDPRPTPDNAFLEAMREQIIATPMPTRQRRRPGRRRPGTGRVRGRWVTRPLPVLSGGMALAAVGAAVLVVALGAGGGDPAPAYAVTLGRHTVTIYWREWRDVGALNARLRELGVRIRVVPVVHGCVAPVRHVIYARADSNVPTHVAPGPPTTIEVTAPPPSSGVSADTRQNQGSTFTTWNNTLPGRTRIFVVSRSGWQGASYTVVGQAPACVGDTGPVTPF